MQLRWDVEITDVSGNKIVLPAYTRIRTQEIHDKLRVLHYILRDPFGTELAVVSPEQLAELEEQAGE